MKKLFLILVTVFLNVSLFANTNNAEAYSDHTPIMDMTDDNNGPILPPPPPPPGGSTGG